MSIPTPPNANEMIAFGIGSQEFCVYVRSIREIRSWTPVTRIPHAPSYVLGIVNLRGLVLPIVDLAARLGYPSVEPGPRHAIMVAETQSQIVGLLVDGVSDIITVEGKDIQPVPDVASSLARDFVSGIISVGSRLISVITLENLMPQTVATVT
jgi:purine-binding chemotaxis protein CheW